MSSDRTGRPPGARQPEGDGPQHPAFAFRFEDLTDRQLRAVRRALKIKDLEELSERRRVRLECYAGMLLRTYCGSDPLERVKPRIVARLLRHPDKLLYGVRHLRYEAAKLARARLGLPVERPEEAFEWESLDVEGAPGPTADAPAREAIDSGRPAGGQREPEAPPHVEFPEAEVEDPAHAALRRMRRDVERDPAFHFRLEALTAAQTAAVERHLRGRGTSLEELGPGERIELESRLGVYLRELAHRGSMETVDPETLEQILSRPQSVLRRASHLEHRVVSVLAERWRRWAEEGGSLEPEGEAAARRRGLDERILAFRLEDLSSAQRRALGRHLLHRRDSRAWRGPIPSARVASLESYVAVLLDATVGLDGIARLPARAFRRILDRPAESVPEPAELPRRAAEAFNARLRTRSRRGERQGRPLLLIDRWVLATTPRQWGRAWRRWTAPLKKRIRGLDPRRWLPPRAQELLAPLANRSTWISFGFIALGAYLVTETHTLLFGQRAEAEWFRGSLVELEAARHEGLFPLLGVGGLSLWLLIGGPWSRLGRPPLRRAVLGLTLMLALWGLSTPPNPYFGNAFAADRLLIAALAALVWLHPAALPPFLLQVLNFVQQRRHPFFSGFSYLHYPELKEPLIEITLALLVFALLRSMRPVRRWVPSPALGILATAALSGLYLGWGLSLVRLGPRPWTWVVHNRLGNVIPAAWQAGWRPWPSEAAMAAAAGLFDGAAPLLQGAFLLLCLAAPLSLAHPRLPRLVFGALALFHLGHFLLSGVFYWGWFLAALVTLAIVEGRTGTRAAPTGVIPGFALLTIVLVVPRTDHDFDHAFWNTRLISRLTVEAVDEAGEAETIPSLLWSPYEQPFRLQRGLLSDLATPVTLGGTTKHLQEMLRIEGASRGGGDRWLLEARLEAARGPGMLGHFSDDLPRLARVVLERDPSLLERLWLGQPLRAIYPFVGGTRLPGRRWTDLRIRVVDALFDGARVVELGDRLVYEAPLAGADRTARAGGTREDPAR